MRANPYMVLTIFDELVAKRSLALLRGDIISHLSRTEGQVILNQIMDAYLIESQFELVKQFNHDP